MYSNYRKVKQTLHTMYCRYITEAESAVTAAITA